MMRLGSTVKLWHTIFLVAGCLCISVASVSEGCYPAVSERLSTICRSGEGNILPCNETLPNNATAHFECRPGTHWKAKDIGYSDVKCIDGDWNRAFIYGSFCKLECGKALTAFSEPLNSTLVPDDKYKYFPWHASIYMKSNRTEEWEYICGGTLVSLNLVFSVAHCFQSENILDLSKPVNFGLLYNVRIALGKRYRKFDDERDSHAQIFEVKPYGLLVHSGFNKETYQNDLATIILKNKVNITQFVQPACLDLGSDSSEDEQLVSGAVGHFPGWGMDANGNVNDELTIREVPYAPNDVCSKETRLIGPLVKYLSKEKMCGGGEDTSQNLCRGDSGGGYVFQDPKTKRFILRGMASLGNQDFNGFSLFTKVSQHTYLNAMPDYDCWLCNRG